MTVSTSPGLSTDAGSAVQVIFVMASVTSPSSVLIGVGSFVFSGVAVASASVETPQMWNNPSCSKCAAARATFEEAGVPVRLRAYLDDPPNAAELLDVLRRLGAQPWNICRVGEPAAERLGMADWPRDAAHAGRWVDAMVEHPELIQRPIILLDDGSAVVARTPEALAEVIDAVRWDAQSK